MRVLIADDHEIIRRGLQQILADAFPDIAVGEAETAEEALEQILDRDWDVVVLDISMPGRSGLDALKEIKKERPSLPVLVLSIHPEEQFATRVLKAGAAGYMTKETATAELVNAINKVRTGGKYVSEQLAEKLALDLEREVDDKELHQRLSDREYEVLLLIAAGLSITQIAEKLSLSVKTISTYRARILEKTNLNSNADLIRYAIAHRLVAGLEE
ncbi:MAG: response regulator transcription factor [Candidatus Latescibacterota bacterium]|nr:MAG: response regulator transcription factor [Candidatus Latescibacterota bacterium]